MCVLIKDEKTGELDNTIDSLLGKLKNEEPSRWLMRKLQRYSVNVPEWHFKQLQDDCQVEEISPGIWAQIPGTVVYDPVLGLLQDNNSPAASNLVI